MARNYRCYVSLCIPWNLSEKSRSLSPNMWVPNYPVSTKPTSRLLKPWLLVSPAHQRLCYWPCRIVKLLSYMRKDFNYQCLVSEEEWCKFSFSHLLWRILHLKGWLMKRITMIFYDMVDLYGLHYTHVICYLGFSTHRTTDILHANVTIHVHF